MNTRNTQTVGHLYYMDANISFVPSKIDILKQRCRTLIIFLIFQIYLVWKPAEPKQ